MTNPYTVTAIATYFVNADNKEEAKNIVYEAMLGNFECQKILSNGEIYDQAILVTEGTNHTIPLEQYNAKRNGH